MMKATQDYYRAIILILITALFIKVVYVLFGCYYQNQRNKSLNGNSECKITELFIRNDAFWYEKIATHGHEKITPDQLGSCEGGTMVQSYYEFMPLYPFFIRYNMLLFNASFNIIAMIYSLVFSLAAFLLFYHFALVYTMDRRISLWSTLLLMTFPFHYYFSMFYTESLYLLLLLGAFLFVQQKRMFLAGLLAALLVLVRPNGLFMLVPLMLYYIERHVGWNFSGWSLATLKRNQSLLYFLLAPLALLLYCIYLHYMTGDFFAYITARRGWCLYSTFPWEPLMHMKSAADYFKSAYLFLFLALSILLYRKIPLSMQALIWINILLPLTSNLITLPRFISCIFVFSLLFGEWMTRIKAPLRVTLVAALFLLQIFTFTFWLDSHEFSY